MLNVSFSQNVDSPHKLHIFMFKLSYTSYYQKKNRWNLGDD